MRVLNLRGSGTLSGHALIPPFLVIIFFVSALPVFGQEQNSIDTLRQMGKAFAGIAEKASPAVVGIKAEKTVTQDYSTLNEWPFDDPFNDEFFKFFFGPPSGGHRQSPQQRSPQRKSIQRSQGSGFIISADGYILTNNHLVGGADKVNVKLADDKDFEGKIVGTDPESDIAVVKVDSNNLPYLKLADSDTLEVGEWVIAIGNPFGLSHTVTAGIVSAKGRSNVGLAAYEDFIQTDAAINPGNSGGPLLNLDGKVIGINTAIVSRSGGNMGIGFAIPVNMAKAVYEQLVDTGTVVRGYLGVLPQDLNPELAASFGLKEDAKGVVLPEVMEGSVAEKAGLKQGDIVVEFNGKPVEKADAFRKSVAMLRPGTKAEIVVLRDGERKTFTVELSERPKAENAAAEQSNALEQLGLTVQELTDELAKRFGYEGQAGIIVVDVEQGCLAEFAGIRPGNLIIEVNGTVVKDMKEFNKAIEKAANEGTVRFLIKDGQYKRYVGIKIPKK